MVEGEFSSLEHLEKSSASDGKDLSVPSSHPCSRKVHVCIDLDPQRSHPSPGTFSGIPGDFIPLLVSWHLQGLHPTHGILLLAFPGTASLSWLLQGLHPVLMQLEMSLLIAGGCTPWLFKILSNPNYSVFL